MRLLSFITFFMILATQSQGQDLQSPSIIANANSQNAVAAFNSVKQRADSSFNTKNYSQALSLYKILAEVGDKFSQYRLAYMYDHGLGVDRDLQKAFAWSYVAAEKRAEPLFGYHQSVRSKLSPEELARAKELGGEYLGQYGVFTLSNNAYIAIRKQLNQCTGSRLGARCDRVYSSSMSCNLNNVGIPDKTCLVLGAAGLPGVQRVQPLQIHDTQQHLKYLMDRYNPGRVELGEFQVIEDEDELSEKLDKKLQTNFEYKYTIDGIVEEDEEKDDEQDDEK